MGMDLGAWFRPAGKPGIANSDEAPSLGMLSEGEYPSVPIEVTDADLAQAIQSYSLVVVDCWAPWCGPCHMVAPVIAELAKDYVGRIVFGKLNVDENPQTAMARNIRSIFSLLVFDKGQLMDLIVGAQPRETLEPQITRHLGAQA